MNRRSFLVAGAAFAALSATAAFADEDYVKDIVAFLKTHGYTDIAVSRTLLGRVRIVAINSKGKRELICNPRTGEILRDVIITADGEMRPPVETGTPNSGSGNSGTGGGDDHGGDDDDRDDDDHSGHGSGGGDDDNSGHGSGGSGGDDDDSSGHGSGHD